MPLRPALALRRTQRYSANRRSRLPCRLHPAQAATLEDGKYGRNDGQNQGVEEAIAPSIATALPRTRSEPVPWLQRIGRSPAMMATTAIIFGCTLRGDLTCPRSHDESRWTWARRGRHWHASGSFDDQRGPLTSHTSWAPRPLISIAPRGSTRNAGSIRRFADSETCTRPGTPAFSRRAARFTVLPQTS